MTALHQWLQHRVLGRLAGPGISPDVQKRIFEPFFTTKPVGSGTGLGLDVAQRLVNRHEGFIAVTTEPGRTEFRVTLPLAGARLGGDDQTDG